MTDQTGSSQAPPGIVPSQIDIENGHILYDRALVTAPGREFFEPGHWRDANALIGEVPGRATVFFFRVRDRDMALRHYHRGGWVAMLSLDRYLWTSLESTRAWREWRLLAALYGSGMPVPRPVAARVLRHGPCYSADLVTVVIPGARALADLLTHQPLPEAAWREIGRVIRRFHARGVFHADLNARNILIDPAGGITLIDFDKGYQGGIDKEMQLDNLERLQRSLNKFSMHEAAFHFDKAAWSALLSGYSDTP